MNIAKNLTFILLIIALLIPTGITSAIGDIPDPDLDPDPDPDPDPVSDPPTTTTCPSTDFPGAITCGGIEFNPDYLIGEMTLEKDGNTLKITSQGTLYVSGQLSFPLPDGFSASQCIFEKDENPLPNTVFPGNKGNAYIYIWQPPNSINGTYTLSCSQ